jgi:dihydrofolate reductase
MRNLIAITQLTLDGIMQGPGGPEEDPSGGFTQGGWAMPFGDETLQRVMDEIMAGPFDLLLGRRTYEIFADYWPQHGDTSIGHAFAKATKYVVTNKLNELGWQTSVRVGSEAADGVRRLKASDGPDLHIWGSSQLLQALIAADLVDEYRFWVAPVVLGRGKRLFENGVPARKLALVDTRATSTGLLLNTYRPVGPLSPV